MARWRNGNDYTDFAKLFALKRIDDNTYESTWPAYSPGNSTRAYGGHVYAQSAYAAAHTVGKGFVVHSITGWFTLQGNTSLPFTYKITHIRSGNLYSQRQVNVIQRPSNDVMFTAIVSFKRPEPSNQTYVSKPPFERYSTVLSGKAPEDFPLCPGVDAQYMRDIESKRGWVDKFPGLSMRKVGMQEWNKGKDVMDKRQLVWYWVLGRMPKVLDDANLHAIAHLYASDRNGLFTTANLIGKQDHFTSIASLNHTVILHQEAAGLSLVNESTDRPYHFLSEENVGHISHGRTLACWRMFREDGLHVASCFQDGLLRFPSEGGKSKVRDLFGDGVFKEKEKL